MILSRGTRRVFKILGLTLGLLASLLLFEFVREKIVYRQVTSRIASAHEQLRVGMTKDEVRRIAGEPLEIIERQPDEYWTWTARASQGALRRRLGLETMRGHYDLIVRFDRENKITKIFGGVN